MRLDPSGGALRRAFDDGDFLGGEAVELVDELDGLVGGDGILVQNGRFRYSKKGLFGGMVEGITQINIIRCIRSNLYQLKLQYLYQLHVPFSSLNKASQLVLS